MSEISFYHCKECHEEIALEIICPCCGLGEENLLDDFFGWLRVHVSGIKMRYDAMGWEIDWGYIKACDVIEAELRRKLQEHKDGTDRLERDKGLLDEEVP